MSPWLSLEVHKAHKAGHCLDVCGLWWFPRGLTSRPNLILTLTWGNIKCHPWPFPGDTTAFIQGGPEISRQSNLASFTVEGGLDQKFLYVRSFCNRNNPCFSNISINNGFHYTSKMKVRLICAMPHFLLIISESLMNIDIQKNMLHFKYIILGFFWHIGINIVMLGSRAISKSLNS